MLYYCKNHQADFVPDKIKKELEQYKFVFNPSFVLFKKIQYWAFRCYSELHKEILAVIYIYDENSSSLTIHNLNPIFKEQYGIKPADPKLLRIEDKVYCTLNTGYSAKTQNSVFLIQITGNLDIKRCNIEKRSMVEKNWAFFEQNGKLKMLYSISPVCKIYTLSSVNQDEMFFEEERQVKNNLGSLSIGTQPVLNNNTIYLMAHRKYSFLKKRLYLGVPVTIDLNTLDVKASSVSLVHSLMSMFGSTFRFNKNLISCTYISGLQMNFADQKAKITYGINDVSWQAMQVNLNDLW
ncbi:hypothetical protein DU508_22540 [Pedobacter chinensis]|uniref:Uncharacterized protein n=1 Tax=Pedobacter chinensis TaxID=2282421 RepID=A0A369PVX3_9SPHI|nr:hypothetical protein [Pedobacter chinensis]RDC54268.1 hypothetical protein DU508_22540 [Pedobacter chinensis]